MYIKSYYIRFVNKGGNVFCIFGKGIYHSIRIKLQTILQ